MADLASLKKTFKGDLVVPGDPDYEQAIARWARNSTKRAKVVAFVKDPQDVSAVLKFAKTAGLRVAIKGGGHNPAAASSSEGGVVIDLSKYLDKAVVDADKKLAYVGGGSTWRTVDEATIKHGLVTVAGTVNHVSRYHYYPEKHVLIFRPLKTGVGGYVTAFWSWLIANPMLISIQFDSWWWIRILDRFTWSFYR